MPISTEYVRELFGNLEAGKLDVFFAHVSDQVDWTVMGTHPLAGKYTGKNHEGLGIPAQVLVEKYTL